MSKASVEGHEVSLGDNDVGLVLQAIGRRYKAGKDNPLKPASLAMVVAELEVIKFKDMFRNTPVNVDVAIEKARLWAREQACALYEIYREASRHEI
jgi:hypothetical protein